ncbi:hypothetical protein BT96DRAFT_546450 [Gymnopus androsaceus JB14]|uniref:Uncharacterized protein n=1 Tax=Gymnopus androsaceus JB14 TaxID=1447944 RepID=A0A6A4GLP7_9AGAR|nr:hypothetical protein BT96DRAFT_546450 [Gymnopus androsaceus JB14]
MCQNCSSKFTQAGPSWVVPASGEELKFQPEAPFGYVSRLTFLPLISKFKTGKKTRRSRKRRWCSRSQCKKTYVLCRRSQ